MFKPIIMSIRKPIISTSTNFIILLLPLLASKAGRDSSGHRWCSARLSVCTDRSPRSRREYVGWAMVHCDLASFFSSTSYLSSSSIKICFDRPRKDHGVSPHNSMTFPLQLKKSVSIGYNLCIIGYPIAVRIVLEVIYCFLEGLHKRIRRRFVESIVIISLT